METVKFGDVFDLNLYKQYIENYNPGDESINDQNLDIFDLSDAEDLDSGQGPPSLEEEPPINSPEVIDINQGISQNKQSNIKQKKKPLRRLGTKNPKNNTKTNILKCLIFCLHVKIIL